VRADVVVIGAGPGGLAAAAMARERGLEAVVIERDEIGASWRRHYDRLHLHTVRWLSNLPGLRFSRRHGPWVSRDGVVRYLEAYVRHHGLDVRTGVAVERIDRHPDGDGWRLATSQGDVDAWAVVVATGYNRVPVMPEWPGREEFEGELIHGCEYRNPEPYRGRDVLVVGAGNTGAEIAVDLVEGGARRVRLAFRTPPNVLLRDVAGTPSQVVGLVMRRLPPRLADRIVSTAQRLTVGDLSTYGLPRAPRGPISQAVEDDVVPILDVGMVKLVKERRIEPVPAVTGFDGREVVLADGRRVTPDAVIACAGYQRGLEPLVGHLADDLIGAKGRPTVHGERTHPSAPRLHFIGFTNPLSGMFREFGIDAKRIARALAAQRSSTPAPQREPVAA
jgi:putative flavoprotein involved in K+ transport